MATIHDEDREFLRVYAACLKAAAEGGREHVLHNRKLNDLILEKLSQRRISIDFRPPTVEELTVEHSYDGYTWYKSEQSQRGWYRECNDDNGAQWYPDHTFVGRTVLWW